MHSDVGPPDLCSAIPSTDFHYYHYNVDVHILVLVCIPRRRKRVYKEDESFLFLNILFFINQKSGSLPKSLSLYVSFCVLS